MRLHRLQLEAFGPFGDPVDVDFERLSDAGLFLLHGPTGSGKTSVLDGICFALFGRVPGVRSAGRPHLRSDHAPDGARPRVLLELTVGGRRLEVARSPEWQRPKKRGAGTTKEPATADVREWVDGRWEVLVARRSDEAGLLLADLLGIGMDEFTKVVMLPQGDFAAFLQAGAEQRAELLARLFDIDQYAGVERVLRDRRQSLAKAVEEADVARDRLLARAHEAFSSIAGPPLGPDEEIAVAAPPGPQLADAMAATAGQALLDADAMRTAAAAAAAQARAALEQASDAARRNEARTDLTRRLNDLAERAACQVQRMARVGAARRAQPLYLLLERLHAAEIEVDRTGKTLAQLGVASGCEPGPAAAEPDDPGLRLRQCRDELVRLEDAEAVVRRHQDLTARLCEATAAEATAAGRLEAAERAVQDSSALVRAQRLALEQETASAASGVQAARALVDADRALAASLELVDCEQDLVRLTDERRVAQDDDLARRQELVDVRERRVDGMAAELATALVARQPCPVCGGTEHPHPAPPVANPVDDTAEREFREAADVAAVRLAKALRVESACQARAAALRVACGGLTSDAAAAAQAAARQASDLAKTAQAAATRIKGELIQAESSLKSAEQEQSIAARAHTEALVACSAVQPQVDELSAALRALRGDDPDVQGRVRRLCNEVAALQRLQEARETSTRAHADRLRLHQDVESASVSAGFEDIAAARAALLTPQEIESLEHQIADHDREEQEVTTLLAALESASAGGGSRQSGNSLPMSVPVSVPVAETAVAAAMANLQAAERKLALSEQASTALSRIAAELHDHEDLHRDARAHHDHVAELSRCVDGTGGGNALRMRLSAYVLAARLEEVAAAATERLLVMSDGRFSLEHTDALARSGARSGLGLRVLDSWTGTWRETATLSGGETFLASLSLALGLADVVSAEAGGASMETLFVDEGFGTLDEDTLEEVMGVLDSLREGGRAVGLVSHVADLRDRIPAQLSVTKGRTGSAIRQV